MSRAGAMVSGFVVAPDVLDVVRTLALTRDLTPVVIAERNIDVLSHHRSGVLKDASKNFERGRGAQRFLAPRLKRFGRTTGRQLPTFISEARGESFAAERDGVLEGLEEGGPQNTNESMAVPIAAKYRGARGGARFREKLERNQFVLVGSRGLLIDPDDRKQSERTEIAGILTKRITRKPRLGFFKRWDMIRPKALAKYERDLDLLTTEAGRGKVRSKLAADRITRHVTPQVVTAALAAGEREYQSYIKANPGDVPGARAAKRRAAKAVRRDLLERARGEAGGLG